MRDGQGTPTIKYRQDYVPPAYLAESIDLSFDIHSHETTVTAKTSYKRVTDNTPDLRLDGEKLELVSLLIDGTPLDDSGFKIDDTSLTIYGVPDTFTLTVVTKIKPEANTDLEGLYCSNGMYCTQCEAEGFRKITYFQDRPDVLTSYTVRIEADKTRLPVLLSNGNRIEVGDLSAGRHYAVWQDPFPKPSYLFALVAGDLAHIHDTFTTMSGRSVDLYIYTDHGNAARCHHAMTSLKKSMLWDEEAYGREYDLDIFNIVAVNDFNAGAMENKSLNIFNSKLVLADPETATDTDYLLIEAIIAHEYFHNWSGNRVTCRDWFQLSLKEGFTVYRELQFSGEMNDRDVKRIEDVELLRNRQFPEDAGPLAHPIRPDSFIEINNFYTPTVYEKGAEVIGMLHTLMGDAAYRAGCDLYFSRHDGQAVTCDDFLACMQACTDIDLEQFSLWYSQAGTPTVTAQHRYDIAQKKLVLSLTQQTAPTPGQSEKPPLHIPVKIGLIAKSDGRDLLSPATQVLHLREQQQDFVFENISEDALPSLLRGFSAPVKLVTDLTDDDLFWLMAHDSDGFNRWDAGQTALQRLLLRNTASGEYGYLPDSAKNVFQNLLEEHGGDTHLRAMALTLPSENYLGQLMPMIDVDGIHAARRGLMQVIGETFYQKWQDIYHALTPLVGTIYQPNPQQIGARALRNLALRYLQAAKPADAALLASEQYHDARNMTDRIGALKVLVDLDTPQSTQALSGFYDFAKNDPLLLDKWFAVQALADHPDNVGRVASLTQHPDFTLKNPNRLRSLLGNFAHGNPVHFHRADGQGYRLLADAVIAVNRLNPQAAARIVAPLGQWRRYDAQRQALMEAELRRILAEKDISNDLYEIISKSLG